MLRKIARSHEAAAAQIEHFSKPKEVKLEERKKVNCLLKKSTADRYVNFNTPKLL